MKYGCIGEHLSHSFSKEIHNSLAGYEYELVEIEKGALSDFAKRHDFLAINVTIPYKELIMPHMYHIDEHAAAIGAVNTVVNRNGKLYGYNTDFYGMCELLSHAGVSVKGKKVLILGTGGTSKTADAVARHLGACEIIKASRTKKNGALTYEEIYRAHTNAEVIINTTPVGMFPNIYNSPIDISCFERLSGVIDAIYNPLSSELISDAAARGIPAEGGLYMLVAQGVRASEIFTDTEYPDGECERVYKKLLSEKENIVLTGMPASGKSTVGKLLSEELSRSLIDTDALIEERAQMPISEIFKKRGEAHFRLLESEVIKEISALTGVIIATGGGAVLRSENVRALKKNGRIYFIDRPPHALIPTVDRPLASTEDAIARRYKERYPIYTASADVRIDAACDAECVAQKIKGDFLNEACICD